MTKLLKGLKQVSTAALSGDGTMPAGLAKLGIVTEEGVSISEAAPSIEDLKECGNANPIGQNATLGKVEIKFKMMITDAALLAKLRGGTATGSAWTPGTSFTMPEMAMKIETPTATISIEVPRASVYGVFSGTLGDKGQVVLDCTATPLDTGFAGKSAYTINI